MNKKEFLLRLRKGLSALPQDNINEHVMFYSEMIEDRMEDGLPECEAVAEVGSVEDIISQILSETPRTEREGKRRVRALEIVLLVLGAPLWIPLLLGFFSIVFSAFAVIWSLVVTLWSVFASLVGGAVGGIFSALVFIVLGNGLVGLLMLGVGICLSGVAIVFFIVCLAVTKLIALLTKKTAIGIKYCFTKRRDGNA